MSGDMIGIISILLFFIIGLMSFMKFSFLHELGHAIAGGKYDSEAKIIITIKKSKIKKIKYKRIGKRIQVIKGKEFNGKKIATRTYLSNEFLNYTDKQIKLLSISGVVIGAILRLLFILILFGINMLVIIIIHRVDAEAQLTVLMIVALLCVLHLGLTVLSLAVIEILVGAYKIKKDGWSDLKIFKHPEGFMNYMRNGKEEEEEIKYYKTMKQYMEENALNIIV